MRLLLTLLVVLAVVCVWNFRRLTWLPRQHIRTEHYYIQSSATRRQTAEIAAIAEELYVTYTNFFVGTVKPAKDHPRLCMKLFKDRNEFRRCNGITGWEEAFYVPTCCYQYYSESTSGRSPHHWMVHEATHQLNGEVAGLSLTRWSNEGLASYFSTSLIRDGDMQLGLVNPGTYPIWWLSGLQLSGDLDKDQASGKVIPLQVILQEYGGPDINRKFNLYYIHWWSLAHFLFHYEDGKYADGFHEVILAGGRVDQFEQHIGPVEAVQREWHAHLIALISGEFMANTSTEE
jgi:hypothetical protein